MNQNFTTKEITKETTKEKIPNRIIDLMEENPSISAEELANQLDITANGVRYHIKKLKAEGRIEHHGANKGGYWKVLHDNEM